MNSFHKYSWEPVYGFVNLCIKDGKAVFYICPMAVAATMYRNIWSCGV